MNINELRRLIERKKGKKEQIVQSIKENKQKIVYLKKKQLDVEQAQTIIRIVAEKTQEQLKYHITNISTLALACVFSDPYELDVNFVPKRGKTEAEISFVRDGEKFKPLDDTGIGAVDIGCLGLKMSLWNIMKNKSRRLFLLDEPFKHLRGIKQQKKACDILKMLYEKLGIQIIMVGDVLFTAKADKIFEVNKKGKYSYVDEI